MITPPVHSQHTIHTQHGNASRGMMRLRALYGRIRAFLDTHLWIGDTVIAALLWICIVNTYGTIVPEPGLIIDYSATHASFATLADQVFTALITLTLCLRRTHPVGSAYVFVGIVCFQLLVGPVVLPADVASLFFIYAAIRYGMRKYTPGIIALSYTMSAITLGVAVVAYSKNYLSPYYLSQLDDMLSFAFAGCIMIVLPVTAIIVTALWDRSRADTAQLILEQTQALEISLTQRAQVARTAERARIARDMHDVVAHTLSIIIVQADAGRLAGAHNLQVAIQTMSTIVQQSTQALTNMHGLLGIIQDDQAESVVHAPHPAASHTVPLHPLPQSLPGVSQVSHPHWYANIDQLIEQATLASPDCTFTRTIQGQPTPELMHTQTAMCMYRVVQESLSNIRKHAGPHVHVTISESWNTAAVTLTITDNGRGMSIPRTTATTPLLAQSSASHGFGLLGMRERVHACGGTLENGPRLEGGFRVAAMLPLASHNTTQHAYHTDDAYHTNITQHTNTTQHSHTTLTTDTPSLSEIPPYTASLAHKTQSTPYSPPRIARHLKSLQLWWQQQTHHLNKLRSNDPFQPKTQDTQSNSVITRLANWTSKHYVIVDALFVTLLLVCSLPLLSEYTQSNIPIQVAFAVAEIIPLVIRRRFPQVSAAIIGGILLLHAGILTLLPVSLPVSIGFNPVTPCVTLVSLYSVILYGRPKAVYWVYPLTLVGSIVAGLSLALTSTQYIRTLHSSPRSELLLIAAFDIGTILIMCIITIITAHFTKSRNTNLWVLQARQEALREQEEQRIALAANTERSYIAAAIQQEVTDTLSSVIIQAQDGLQTLNQIQESIAHNQQQRSVQHNDAVQLPVSHHDNAEGNTKTDPDDYVDTVAHLFSGIAQQGRVALARMRQLLRLLRDTSDTDASTATDHAPLRPVDTHPQAS